MPKNKFSTGASSETRGEQKAAMPEAAEFRAHIREVAREGLRVLLESVLREELTALIGVEWGESGPARQGYRNGV